jgi:zinc protease
MKRGVPSEEVPQPGELPNLRLGRVHRSVLANGPEVIVVPRPTVPRVELRVSVPAGSAAGDSAAAAELLRMGIPLGTRELDQEQLAERLQDLGGALQVHQDLDRLTLSAAALSEAESELYQLVAALVQEPDFPRDDLAIERAKLVEGLRSARATPHFPAHEALGELVYGRHPYGRREPTEGEVARTGRRALQELHRSTFTPSLAQITVVGDVDPRTTMRRLRSAFSAWRGPRKGWKAPRVRAGNHTDLLYLERPGSVQTVVIAASSGPTMGEPGHIAFSLATAVLGGGFNSRMMANLREDKGYTYSPHARVESHRRDGLASASMEVRTDVTAAALAEFRHELARLATVPVPPDELATTRSYLEGARLVTLQTHAGLASALAQIRGLGLDHRYLERYQEELERCSAEEVMEAARRYLAPTRMTTVLVGDESALPGLEALAPVRRRRPRGG